jgi:hypothetical protein
MDRLAGLSKSQLRATRGCPAEIQIPDLASHFGKCITRAGVVPGRVALHMTARKLGSAILLQALVLGLDIGSARLHACILSSGRDCDLAGC